MGKVGICAAHALGHNVGNVVLLLHLCLHLLCALLILCHLLVGLCKLLVSSLEALGGLDRLFVERASVGMSDRASPAPQLAGRQLAGVSRNSASIVARWRARDDLTFRCLVRLLGRRYEDNENTLRLGAAAIVDFGLNYAVGEHMEVFSGREPGQCTRPHEPGLKWGRLPRSAKNGPKRRALFVVGESA